MSEHPLKHFLKSATIRKIIQIRLGQNSLPPTDIKKKNNFAHRQGDMVCLQEKNKPNIAQFNKYEPMLFEKADRKDKMNMSLGSAGSFNRNMLASTKSGGGADYLSEVQHPDYLENDSMFAQSFGLDPRGKLTRLDETLEFHHNYSDNSDDEESESPGSSPGTGSGTTSPSDDCSTPESPESPETPMTPDSAESCPDSNLQKQHPPSEEKQD